MRSPRYTALCLALLAAACSKAADKAPDTAATAAMTPAPPPPPPPLSLASVAGKWNMVSKPTTGTDTSSTMATLNATADTTGWTLTLKDRPPVKLHVRADGDSLMITSETYNSVRRKGVKVFTSGVHRMQGDKLVGTTTAHYSTKTPDSVLVLTSESTKAP
jgi:hypothetical protein